MIYLTPVLPELSKKSQILFKEQLWTWSSLENPLLSCNISNYKPLLLRIEKSEVNKPYASLNGDVKGYCVPSPCPGLGIVPSLLIIFFNYILYKYFYLN